jgi:hypothetical protein
VATLDLQFRDHALLSLIGDTGLVEQAPTEVSGVVPDEDVAVM